MFFSHSKCKLCINFCRSRTLLLLLLLTRAAIMWPTSSDVNLSLVQCLQVGRVSPAVTYRSVARCQQLEASPAVRPGHGGRPPGRRRRRTQRRAAEFTSGTNEM